MSGTQSLGIRIKATEEGKRLFSEPSVKLNAWRKWGPYLSERQWGTVREDYSADGCAWEYFSHDQARSRAYRWGEDGIAGISDNHQILCFAFAFWNKKDPILKERLFGLTGNEGNHGEDVKEVYYYLDNTPTHSYMKYLYRYTQKEFPYSALVNDWRNTNKDRNQSELELVDTGAFDDGSYFDIGIEYAKNSEEDISIKVTITNCNNVPAQLTILPTLWFRNIWSWKKSAGNSAPSITRLNDHSVKASSTARGFGDMYLHADSTDLSDILFCNNETNLERFNWGSNNGQAKKDGINEYIVKGYNNAVGKQSGTKASFQYELSLAAGECKTLVLRLCRDANPSSVSDTSVFAKRKQEADAYYNEVFAGKTLSQERIDIARQAYAGMLWSKQFFHYIVEDWLNGDDIPPPPERKHGRNAEWKTLYNEDIISMPDKWEYPWFATWDLAFHTIVFSEIDPDFAKYQLRLFTCEWYMHPNGQLPAYEWNFNDVNPPVHAYAALKVYQKDIEFSNGTPDLNFLSRVFSKLLMYFTWWTNRKDAEGNNIFEGGFLGLDNISVLDRSNLNLGTGAVLEQADGTGWMGIFCLNMLKMSVELAKHEDQEELRGSTYSDMAYKFFQHFLLIANSFNTLGLWDDTDGFYYDRLKVPRSMIADNIEGLSDPVIIPLKLRSMVGLLPLVAVETISKEDLQLFPNNDFKDRVDWFIANRKDLTKNENIYIDTDGDVFLSLVSPDRISRILEKMLSPDEFLSAYGIRSLSKIHDQGNQPYVFPYTLRAANSRPEVHYCPAESDSGMFGGNSNWRGPIWLPVNFIIIDALKKHAARHQNSIQVRYPNSNAGTVQNLDTIANDLKERVIGIFTRTNGKRAVFGGALLYQTHPDWQDKILFYEYFHGDNGAGIGASHQTGWTGLIASMIA